LFDAARHLDPRELDPVSAATWRSTLLASARPASFMGPSFARAVASVRGGVRVCVLTAAGRSVGFFPFQWKQPLGAWCGVAERLGEELSDYAGLVAPSGLHVTADRLLRLAGLNSFGFSHLEESQLALGLAGEAPRTGLIIDLGEGVDVYWQKLRSADAALIRDTERRRRKIEKDIGPIRFCARVTDGPTRLAEVIAWKRAQYQRTGVGDSLGVAWKRELLARLASLDDPDCAGILSSLHAGDTWVAHHFGLRCGPVLHYWFPVYNPDLARYSPGRLLLEQVINAAGELAITRIDRGEGDSKAKRDFANREHLFYRGEWRVMGPRLIAFKLWERGRRLLAKGKS
jgi:CelD/BcsL family acetyltransferase involved in cellulose biosynthesis